MNIADIKNPQFLKKLSENELISLASDIRHFLITSIAKTGGHLSSNLGVVELTIALHYVFNAPKDKLLFDVGHQAYTHKILTGRGSCFNTLRTYKGLSGFQKRNESIYDCFEAGHSSTSLSAALGMAVARDLNGEHYEVIPIIGDAAISSGMALEALNEIGYEKRKVIIILNDNIMSISTNVGALSQNLERLRHSKPYVNLKIDLKSYLNNFKIGKKIINGLHNTKEIIKKNIVNAGIFNELNLEYYGPVDGHNIHDLIRVFSVAKITDKPCIIHVVTKKGKGYYPAEQDKIGLWHGVGPFDLNTGKFNKLEDDDYASTSKIIADIIENKMAQDKNIITITPAMLQGSCLNNIFAKYPERSFDTGITEEHAMTFAAGLALNNKRPFLSIYSTFMQRAYDQLNHDVCRMDLPVVLGIDRAGLVGADGATHHGLFDVALFRSLPNIIVCEGKDASEMEALLNYGFNQKHPFAIRYPRLSLPINKTKIDDIKKISWEIIKDFTQSLAIILAYGPDVSAINDLLIENNLPYGLINCRFLKPLDNELLHVVLRSGLPIYIYETDMRNGGFGEAILQFSAKYKYHNNIHLGGIGDYYVEQGSISQLRKACGIDIETFLAKMENDLC